jgi:nucleoside-diphosphate-sugar epimerase
VTLAGRRVLLTGATGFVGTALSSRLLELGAHVVCVSRTQRESQHARVEWFNGDVEDTDAMLRATRGVDAVFHVGGMVGHYGLRASYLRANVLGTQNILAGARKNGVRSLVFTSTPSVIADGTPHFDVDETHPYSRRYQSPYSESKALAEQDVLRANGPDLGTVAIRPHMIWGPGPSHWVGGVRKLSRKGMLYQMGKGTNRVGMTYMDDCVAAHIAALHALESDKAVGGRAFFIHGGSPVSLWQWVRDLTAALSLPSIRGTLPTGLMKVAAGVCDGLVVASRGSLHFPISRYLMTEMTTDHYSCIDAARKNLGYEPKISVAGGLARLAEAERIAGLVQRPSVEPALTS